MLAGLKWGAIVGVAVYIVGVALDFFNNSLVRGAGSIDVTQHPQLLIPTCLIIFALLFACSAAGFYTGRETGVAGLGAVAGIVVLVVQYVLGLIYNPANSGARATVTTNPGANTAVLVLANLTSLLLVIGIAACMGWLGGRPGARRSPLNAKPPTTTTSDPFAGLILPPPPPSEGDSN